jgi:hypothetical protein
MRPIVLASLAILALAAGCVGRKAHLIPGFGRSVDPAFAAQAPRRAPTAPAVLGLDPQEASVVSQTYLNGLAPKGEQVKEEPMILVAPQTRDRLPQPAPSVPRE